MAQKEIRGFRPEEQRVKPVDAYGPWGFRYSWYLLRIGKTCRLKLTLPLADEVVRKENVRGCSSCRRYVVEVAVTEREVRIFDAITDL